MSVEKVQINSLEDVKNMFSKYELMLENFERQIDKIERFSKNINDQIFDIDFLNLHIKEYRKILSFSKFEYNQENFKKSEEFFNNLEKIIKILKIQLEINKYKLLCTLYSRLEMSKNKLDKLINIYDNIHKIRSDTNSTPYLKLNTESESKQEQNKEIDILLANVNIDELRSITSTIDSFLNVMSDEQYGIYSDVLIHSVTKR